MTEPKTSNTKDLCKCKANSIGFFGVVLGAIISSGIAYLISIQTNKHEIELINEKFKGTIKTEYRNYVMTQLGYYYNWDDVLKRYKTHLDSVEKYNIKKRKLKEKFSANDILDMESEYRLNAYKIALLSDEEISKKTIVMCDSSIFWFDYILYKDDISSDTFDIARHKINFIFGQWGSLMKKQLDNDKLNIKIMDTKGLDGQ
jgi:hypothetical protein